MLDLEKKLTELIGDLDVAGDNEIVKTRVQLQLKALDLLLKVRQNQEAVKGTRDDEDEHPAVLKARSS